LFLALLGGAVMWFVVNKNVEDFSTKTPIATFQFHDIISQAESDTASLARFRDQLIAVTGQVKTIVIDSNTITLELGDTTTASSIVCQIDNRYTANFKTMKEGKSLSLKGILRSFEIDNSGLGMGSTLQMNYCTLHQ
jgi:hypothetical protein